MYLKRLKIPFFVEQEEYVVDAIRKGHLAVGPHTALLKEQLATLLKRRYVVLTSNGFSALFSILKSLELPLGTKVYTTATSTCFAIVNAIKAAGYETDFLDIETDSLSIDSLTANNISNKSPIISPNHFGRISGFSKIKEINNFLIEDAAQSFFSSINLQTKSNTIILSFYPSKLIIQVNFQYNFFSKQIKHLY